MHTCKSLLIVTQRVQRFKSYPEFCSCRTGPLAEQSETCWLTDSRIRIIRFEIGVDRKFDRPSFSLLLEINRRNEKYAKSCWVYPFLGHRSNSKLRRRRTGEWRRRRRPRLKGGVTRGWLVGSKNVDRCAWESGEALRGGKSRYRSTRNVENESLMVRACS